MFKIYVLFNEGVALYRLCAWLVLVKEVARILIASNAIMHIDLN